MKTINALKSVMVLTCAVFMLFLVSCQKENLTTNEDLQISEVNPIYNDDGSISFRSDCEELKEFNFELTYENIKDHVINSNYPSSMTEDELKSWILSLEDCLDSEQKVIDFIVQMASLDGATSVLFFDVARTINGGVLPVELSDAFEKALTKIDLTYPDESPILSIIDPGKESKVHGIIEKEFKNTEKSFKADGEKTCELDTYLSCESNSFSNKKWKFITKKAKNIAFSKRKEGKWFSKSICGFRLYNFPGNGQVKGTRHKLIDWRANALALLHGFRFPFNRDNRVGVFVHRLPYLLLWGINQDCDSSKNWIKKVVRARVK